MTIAGTEQEEAMLDSARYREVEPLLRKTLEVRLKLLGENDYLTAFTYNNLASALMNQGRFNDALPHFKEALRIKLRVMGEDHPSTANGYRELALNLSAMGRFSEAEPLLRKALEISRRVVGEDHPDTALNYNSLGALLNNQSKFAEAELPLRIALAAKLRRLGEWNPSTAASYNNLAFNLNSRGRFAEAEPMYEKTVAICLRVMNGNDPRIPLSCLNLAWNLHNQGRFDDAEPRFRDALDRFRQSRGEQHSDTAYAWMSLSQNLRQQGKLEEAASLDQKALDIQRRALGEDHPRTGLACSIVADRLLMQGQFADAEKLYREALKIHLQVFGEDHLQTARSYYNLAEAFNGQGNYIEARAMAAKSARSFEAARLQNSFAGLERLTLAAQAPPLTILAAIESRLGDDQAAYRSWESSLARGLFDDLATRRERALTPEERSRQDDLVGQLNRLDNQLAALGAAKMPTEVRRKRLDELKDQRLDAQKNLAQSESNLVKKYQVAVGAHYDLERIQARIPADAALVGWLDLKTHLHVADPAGDHLACVVRRAGAPMWIRISGTGPDRAWTPADDDRPRKARRVLREGLTSSEKAALGGLADQWLKPLEAGLQARDGLPRVQHLIILPSPALAGIPIEALLDVRAPEVPSYLVSYAPSGTMFAWLRERRAEDRVNPAPSRRLLALGDPLPSARNNRSKPPQAPRPGPARPERPATIECRKRWNPARRRARLLRRVQAGDTRGSLEAGPGHRSQGRCYRRQGLARRENAGIEHQARSTRYESRRKTPGRHHSGSARDR